MSNYKPNSNCLWGLFTGWIKYILHWSTTRLTELLVASVFSDANNLKPFGNHSPNLLLLWYPHHHFHNLWMRLKLSPHHQITWADGLHLRVSISKGYFILRTSTPLTWEREQPPLSPISFQLPTRLNFCWGLWKSLSLQAHPKLNHTNRQSPLYFLIESIKNWNASPPASWLGEYSNEGRLDRSISPCIVIILGHQKP